MTSTAGLSDRVGIALIAVLMLLGLDAILRVGSEAAGSEPRPPRTEITRVEIPSGAVLTRKSLAVFRFRSDSRSARFECSLDRSPWRGCRAGVFRTYVDPGRHRFRVRVVEPGGGFDPTPAVRIWRVERWRPDLRAANRYAAAREGRVSFSLDIGWRSWGRDAGLRARMASTVKAMLMVAYLNMADVRDRRLTGYEKGLISPMIKVSDNYAANSVASVVGPSRMRGLARRVGLEDFEYSTIWGRSITTAADQARFMRALPGLLPERHRAWAMGLMKRIEGYQRWGISKARPKGWKLFFKGGWGISDGRFGGTVNHQIALLRRGGLRVGVAILTQGNPWTSYGEKTLREVAARLLRGLPRE